MKNDRDLVTVVPPVRRVNEKQASIATINQPNIEHPLPAVGAQSVGKAMPIATPTTLPLERPKASNPLLQSQVLSMNKYLNDSGQPNRFRMDPDSGSQLIQEINPATGDVIGEYSVTAFPALAKSLGLVGSLVNSRA
jgi:hypothetical protein